VGQPKNPFKDRTKAEEVVQEILGLLRDIDLDNGQFLEDQSRWYGYYRGIIGDRSATGTANEGWANAHVPITAWNVLKTHEQLMGVYEFADPLLTLEPKNDVAARFREQVQGYLNSLLKDEDQIDVMKLIDESLLHLVIHGSVTGFLHWERWRDFAEETHIIHETPNQSPEGFARLLIQTIFPSDRFDPAKLKIKRVDSEGESTFFRATFQERLDKNELLDGSADIEISRLQGTGVNDIPAAEVTVRMMKVRERPVVEIPPVELVFKTNDFVHKGIDRCKMIGKRFTLMKDDIENGFISGRYDLMTEDDFTKLHEKPEGKEETSEARQVDQVRQDHQGQIRSFANQEIGEFDALEVFMLKDALGMGTPQQWIFTVLEKPAMLLRARLLSNVFQLRNGRRPIFHVDLIPDKNSGHGIGIPELVEGVQVETDEIHSIGLDWGHISLAPWFFYRQGANIKPNARLIKPGSGVPVDDPQTDVAFPQWNNQAQTWALNQEAVNLGYLERLLIPEISFGRVPTGKSAAFRTAATTQSLISQGGSKLDVFLRRNNRGLSRMASILHDLERRNRKIPLVYQLPESEDTLKFMPLPSEAMESPFIYKVIPTSLTANKDFLAQQAVQRYSIVVNPVAIQTGITTPRNIFEAQKDVLRAFGMKDIDRLVTKPQDASDIPVLSATQALQWIQATGQLPPISPLANLEELQGELTEFLGGQGFVGMDPNAQLRALQYLGLVQRAMSEAARRQQLAESATQIQGLLSQAGGGGPPGPAPLNVAPDNAPVDQSNIPGEFRGA
jgi:hypothetical protein